MACDAANPLSYGSCISSIVGSAAKSVAGDAFDAIAKDFAHAAGDIASWLWSTLSSATAISLGGPGFDHLIDVVAGIALLIAMALFLVQIITSTLRRDHRGLSQAASGLMVALLGTAAAIAVVDVLLRVTDALSSGVVSAITGKSLSALGKAIMAAGAMSALTNPALMLVAALAVVAAVILIWLALMVRKLLVIVTAVFAPVAFSGATAIITRGWVRKWIEGMAALIFSKLILVIILVTGWAVLMQGVGQAATSTGQILTQVMSGVLILAVAGFAPWMALKLVHFVGEHAEGLHRQGTMALHGGQQVVGAAQKYGTKLTTLAATGGMAAGASAAAGSAGGGARGGVAAGVGTAVDGPDLGGPGPGSPGGAGGGAPRSPAGGGPGPDGSAPAGNWSAHKESSAPAVPQSRGATTGATPPEHAPSPPSPGGFPQPQPPCSPQPQPSSHPQSPQPQPSASAPVPSTPRAPAATPPAAPSPTRPATF